MASVLSQVRAATDTLSYSSTPEEIQAYLDIASQFLVEILNMRGMTFEEWNTYRKQTIEGERTFIQEELQRVEGGGEQPS